MPTSWVEAAPDDVSCAAWATPVMLAAISLAPVAASVTWRVISFVVAVCSSTAEAIVFWMSLIRAMTVADLVDRVDRGLRVALDRDDLLADVLGRRARSPSPAP